MTDQHLSQQSGGQAEKYNDHGGVTNALQRRVSSPSWLARAAGVGLCGVSIGFIGLFLFVLETAGEFTLITRPLPMQVTLALPYLIGVFTLATTAGAMLAWRYRYWSLPARIHQTILALLGLAFSWQLSILGFIAL